MATKASFTQRKASRPQAVMLSKRANVFYLEHVKVIQKDEHLVYLTQDGGAIERFFNIPERNTAFVLLGKGTSITDAAMRKMAESNVLVGFCGSGGSPLFGALDITFLAPQSEYRPTEYMQAWINIWQNEESRLKAGKTLLKERAALATTQWASYPELRERKIQIAPSLITTFQKRIDAATSAQDLLLAEAHWAKELYATLAHGFQIPFTRQEGEGKGVTSTDLANKLLDHGNYIAYGYAAVALCGLGISFAFPLLHGKTRRGALVFDVADLIKDAFVMPLAFIAAHGKGNQQEFRNTLIENCQEDQVLDLLFTFLKDICGQVLTNQYVTKDNSNEGSESTNKEII